MSDKTEFIRQALNDRVQSDRLRSLHNADSDAGLIDVCSNDYLGLSRHPAVIMAATKALVDYGAGSRASRLISGTLSIHTILEQKLAAWLDKEAALVFNSGFQMNTSLIAAICDRNTKLFFDKRNHNSLLQGAMLAKSELHRYQHADAGHLETLLKRHVHPGDRVVIVTESLFSMDGDMPGLKEISDLARKYDAILVVDEAHTIGVWGEGGRGLAHGAVDADIVLGTFGKAFGGFGAFAACSAEMRDYLVNFCNGFIYTTALPPSVIGGVTAALELMPKLDAERSHVLQLSVFFREHLSRLGCDISGSESQIIPLVVGGESETMDLSNRLTDLGYRTMPVRPPTVESGRCRLRFTVAAFHDEEQISNLVDYLEQYFGPSR